MPDSVTARGQLTIHIPDVPLAKKLDLIAAVLAAVREAHRDDMSPGQWSMLSRAQQEIADAMLCRRNPERRLL